MYWLTGILGLGLMLAPFIFGYSNNSIALWTNMILGGAVVVVSFAERLVHDRDMWEYWVAGGIGFVAVVAPFLFEYSNHTGALWTSTAFGILLIIVAGSKYYSNKGSYW